MKILRLRLNNLHSLRNASEIDFTQPPLAGAGLFAITGPTGAGKTTLLDAITLALYGRVARYESSPNPESVMSRHTGECSAEVEFTCSSGTFRSSWHLSRARKKADGNLQQAKRRVVALPAETIIAETIKEADAKIVELTGLDYDRFLRSVLLAQGEFAAFLKANAKERTELLQQVTGTAIYQEISQAAYRRAANAEQALAKLEAAHQSVPLLSESERAQHETNRQDLAKKIGELGPALQALAQRISGVEAAVKLSDERKQLASDQASLEAKLASGSSRFAQLAAHERATPLLPALTKLASLEAEQKKDTAQLEEKTARQPDVVRQLRLAEVALAESEKSLSAHETGLNDLRALWTEVTELDRELGIARESSKQAAAQHAGTTSRLAVLKQSHAAAVVTWEATSAAIVQAEGWQKQHAVDASLAHQLPEIRFALERWETAVRNEAAARHARDTQTRNIESLTAQLRTAAQKLVPLKQQATACRLAKENSERERLATGGSLAEADTRREELQTRRAKLERWVAEAHQLQTGAATLETLHKRATEMAAELTAAKTAVGEGQQRSQRAEELVAANRSALRLAERIQSLENQRRELKDAQPCPLCGAVHHPFATPGMEPADEVAELRRKEQAAEVHHRKERQQLTEVEKHHSSLQSAARVLTEQIQQLERDWRDAEQRWNTGAETGLAGWQEGEQLTAALATAQAAEQQSLAQATAIRLAEAKMREVLDSLQAADLAVERASGESARQEALAREAADRLSSLLTEHLQCVQTVAEQQARFAKLITDYGVEPPDLTAAKTQLIALQKRQEAYAHQEVVLRRLLGDQATHAERRNSMQEQLAAATAAADQSQADVNRTQAEVTHREEIRRKKFGEQVVAIARQKQEETSTTLRQLVATNTKSMGTLRPAEVLLSQDIKRLTEVITTRNAERESMLVELRAGARKVGFTDEAAVREALLPGDESAAIAEEHRLLERRRTELSALTTDLTRRAAQLPTGTEADAGQLAMLRGEREAKDAERDKHQIMLGEVAMLLRQDDERRTSQEGMATQIKAARQDHERWARLRALIGSADGSVFARFAQGLSLERLTLLANRHLSTLNPRYSMKRANDEAGDLGLAIVDHYQADTVRPTRSLSGGESFIASLALALGLSELAGGQTSIESLFIDEGFGSLDADTLETAMAALENLQARGKTIGIISHVQAMQERITAQIRVTKEAGGCSRISVGS